METESLNSLVTSAIWRAEQLEQRDMPTVQAWAEVSVLEEALAKRHPPSEVEGAIARRGAVRAALKAGDRERAGALVKKYSNERFANGTLMKALREIIASDDRAFEIRFPHAAEDHRLRDARAIARRFREAGAFGLAA
jgi:hypothetical protein